MNPIGPVNDGVNVVMIVDIPSFTNNLFVTTFNTNIQGDIILLPLLTNNTVNPNLTSNNVLQVAITGTKSNITLTIKNNGGNGLKLAPNMNNTLEAVGASSSTYVTLLQPPNNYSSYQNPPQPGITLCGAFYTVRGQKGQYLAMRYQDPNTGTSETVSGIIATFLPVNLNYSTACTTPVNDPIMALNTFIYAYSKGTSGTSTTASAWTSSMDCTNNVKYMYCAPNSHCGDSGCFGACTDTTKACTSIGGAPFTCTSGGGNVNPPFYQTTAFLIVVAIIVIIILICIFYYATIRNSTTQYNEYEANMYPMEFAPYEDQQMYV